MEILEEILVFLSLPATVLVCCAIADANRRFKNIVDKVEEKDE